MSLKTRHVSDTTRSYLDRIGHRGPTPLSLESLRRLHKKHLLSIPFENLDIHLGCPIILSQDAFYEKIIAHKRGGFCYELNGSFAALLTSLGFKVRMLSARVARKNGGFTPEFDHMTLLVTMKDRWLADVGFGESFTEPKRLDFQGPQTDNGRSTVLLAGLEGGCYPDGMARGISGSLNTSSVFDCEILGILSVDVVFSRLLRTRISRKAECVLC